jgi:hypothetical protein
MLTSAYLFADVFSNYLQLERSNRVGPGSVIMHSSRYRSIILHRSGPDPYPTHKAVLDPEHKVERGFLRKFFVLNISKYYLQYKYALDKIAMVLMFTASETFLPLFNVQ